MVVDPGKSEVADLGFPQRGQKPGFGLGRRNGALGDALEDLPELGGSHSSITLNGLNLPQPTL